MQHPVLCLSKELFKEGSRSHCCGGVICNDMNGWQKCSFMNSSLHGHAWMGRLSHLTSACETCTSCCHICHWQHALLELTVRR